MIAFAYRPGFLRRLGGLSELLNLVRLCKRHALFSAFAQGGSMGLFAIVASDRSVRSNALGY